MPRSVLPNWMIVLLLTGLVLGTLVGPRTAASTATAAAPELVPGSMLVFESERYNTWDVFSANDDGTNQLRLTTHNAPELHPRVNRGYTKITFASNRDTNNYNVFTMNPDGSGLVQLMTTVGEDVYPTWSPDGTRIAFASNRAGNYEVYVMNADGSNVTQLTTDPASDSEPDWSLNGNWIAFTSQRAGGAHIWKMGSDGSGQTMLANQNKSHNPAWSPDNTQIAFDADADSDGWNELWIMNADGSNQQLLYDPGTNTEAKDPSWSPDGRYIAFSYVHWTFVGDVWVADVRNLQAYDTYNPGTIVPLVTDSGADRNPHWQTTDILAPTTSANPLPELSTGPFTVSWGGYDNGPAGICRYDVQYKDGSGGTWTDWLVQTADTSASFPGVGGHTYYFQVRARDCAYNYEAYPGGDGDTHTLVENWPPLSAVDPLPDHYRGTQIQVTWGGYDPGLSGIATYDVQYKDGAGGTWTTWYTQTTATAATFTGSSGHAYYFRCRATDNAHNVEAWPAGDGDTVVTLYTWAITGVAHDNRETLLAGASANTTPAAFEKLLSNLDGEYGSYVATAAGTYEVNWTKTGHTGLPDTAFGTEDVSFDIILPPGDNVVQNWGFETGQLAPEWLSSGVTLPDVTSTLRHTGDYATLLGCQEGDFVAPYNVSNSPGTSATPMVVADSNGDLHAVWYQNDTSLPGEILYARRLGSIWQPPENLSNSPDMAENPQIAVDANGTVHVVWTEDIEGTPEIYYAYKSASTWLTENVSQNPGASRDPQLVVQSNGTAHLLWRDTTNTPGVYNIYYARRTTAWTTPVQVSDNATSVEAPRLAVESGGIAHAVWSAGEVYYAYRDGSWDTPVEISTSSGTASLARLALNAAEVHVLWIESHVGNNGLYYARYSGSWSSPLNVYSSASTLAEPQVAMDSSAALHAVWRTGTGTNSEIYYARRSGGTWSAVENVSNTTDESSAPQLAVDSTNAAHVAWVDKSTGNYEIAYRDRNGIVWSPLKNASRNTGKSNQPAIFAEGNKAVHLVWADTTWGPAVVLYAQAATNATAGDSQISQRITVTSGMNAPTLSFLYLLDGASPSMGSSLSVLVTTSGGSTTIWSTNATTNDWTHRWFDLSSWAGQSITLTFKVSQEANRLCTWGYVDEVTLGGAYPDLWIAKSGGATALPGEQVTYHLNYGNRGGTAADGVQITDLLPAEIVYLAADPPPDSTAPLMWDVGTVAALGGPYEIVLTATVQPGAVLGATYTNTVSLTTSTTEPETGNNTASAATLIGARIYVPLVAKVYVP